MQSLAEQFLVKILAGIPGLVIRSHEHEEAIDEIHRVCIEPSYQWQLATFDLDEGVQMFVPGAGGRGWLRIPRWYDEQHTDDGVKFVEKTSRCCDPEKAIRSLPGFQADKVIEDADGNSRPVSTILVLKNHSRWLTSPGLIQLVANRLWAGKSVSQHIVLLSHTSELPVELRKMMESGHIVHPLPDREQIRVIIEDTANKTELPEDLEPVIDAAAGFTRMGVEDAVALSLIEKQRVDSETIFDLKAEAFKNSSKSIRIYRGGLTLEDYGGAEFLKEFTMDLLSGPRDVPPHFRPRGIFLLGPSGTGKTHFARCIGSAVHRAVAICNIGRNKGRYQGEAGENLDTMLDTGRAMSPCIMVLDEVEGQLSGGKDTGATDGGVKAEMNSSLLEYMDNRDDKDVFFIACANDIRPIMRDMPEFTREGRFTGMFFVDLPNRASRDDIWKLKLAAFEFIDPTKDLDEQFAKFKRDVGLPNDTGWTGSTIEACCSIVRARHGKITLRDQGNMMGTVAKRNQKLYDLNREWAEENDLYSTEYPGLYKKARQEETSASSGVSDGTAVRRRVVKKKKYDA